MKRAQSANIYAFSVTDKAAVELIKNNGNEIVKEVGGNMFQATIIRIVENLNNFFDKVPTKELSLD